MFSYVCIYVYTNAVVKYKFEFYFAKERAQRLKCLRPPKVTVGPKCIYLALCLAHGEQMFSA